tara:strand:- start:2985 stop:3851 length:867 start_codon:yes stop_codon:yes gene_type:complete
MKKNILIIGGSGSIGKKIIKKIENEYNIFLIDKKNYNQNSQNIIFNKIDMSDINDLKNNLPKKFIILYLVGNLQNKKNGMELIASINDNIIALAKTLSLLQNKITRLIFLSSISVYGKPKKLPITEETIISPFTDYGVQKACAEIILSSFCKNHNIPFTIIRLSQLFGISSAKYSLPHIIKKNYRMNKITTINVNLQTKRDYVYINDLINFLYLVLKSKTNGIYNFGSGKGTSISSLLKPTNTKIKFKFLMKKNDEPSFSQFYDINKAVKTFGYIPRHDIKSWMISNK